MTKKNKIEGILKKHPQQYKQKQTYIYSQIEGKTSAGESLQGKLQNYLKKSGTIYYKLVCFLGPVVASYRFSHIQKQLLEKYTTSDILLNIGGGPNNFRGREDFINIDIFNFSCIDIVCDATEIPIKDASADLIVNMAMLEHVSNVRITVDEMQRILKVNGELLCYVPFIVPYHASPHDFTRWTRSGAEDLFKKFSQVQVGIGAGPTSGVLWVIQEWLSIILSFGSSKLKDIIFLILMVLTFPLKYLDILLNFYPKADKIASGFYIYAKK